LGCDGTDESDVVAGPGDAASRTAAAGTVHADGGVELHFDGARASRKSQQSPHG